MQLVVKFSPKIDTNLYANTNPIEFIENERSVNIVYNTDNFRVPKEWEVYNPLFLIRVFEKGSMLTRESGNSTIVCSEHGNPITPFFLTMNASSEYQAAFLIRDCIVINYRFFGKNEVFAIHSLKIDEAFENGRISISIIKSILYESNYPIPPEIEERFKLPIQLAVTKAHTKQKKSYYYKAK